MSEAMQTLRLGGYQGTSVRWEHLGKGWKDSRDELQGILSPGEEQSRQKEKRVQGS